MPRGVRATSKAYKATLAGSLQECALQRLQAWARDNCSRSALWQEDAKVVWVAMRERPRTLEAFHRHLRHLLATLSIPGPARGQWLVLLTEEEAKRMITARREENPEEEDQERLCLLTTAPPRDSRRDEETKVVRLPSGFSFEIVRE